MNGCVHQTAIYSNTSYLLISFCVLIVFLYFYFLVNTYSRLSWSTSQLLTVRHRQI